MNKFNIGDSVFIKPLNKYGQVTSSCGAIGNFLLDNTFMVSYERDGEYYTGRNLVTAHIGKHTAYYVCSEDALMTMKEKGHLEDSSIYTYLPVYQWTDAIDEFVDKNNLQLKPFEQECQHQFKNYVGFSQSYEYCVHCDLKRDM